MATPSKYTHDRTVLLLLTVNVFLAVLIAVLVILALTGSSDRALTIEHRPQLGLDANRVGSGLDMASLVVFPLLIAAAHTVLSVKTYPIRRNLSVVVLGMATLLISLSGIVSYYLLQS
ncbi:hypothetical protein E6P97_00115 [Patescibacteria group bacterium]|nr:MAG: hypothetical protein E6P97_00115 [Patescibacteria group bacterium]